MPSHAEQVRILLERTARGGLIVMLALLAYRTHGAGPEIGPERASSADLPVALERWTVRAPASAFVSFEMPPSPAERAWLAALVRAGTPVRWQAPVLPALAVAADRPTGPDYRVRVSIAAPESGRVVLADGSGVIDTLAARGEGGGAVVTIPAMWGRASVSTGRWRASASAPERRAPRRVLVVGAAGWESKFVLAALEEAGWEVDASLSLRPGADVTQGNPAAPDTARYAAVVVLDSVAEALGARIVSFVRSGGGAIIGPDAWRVPALRRVLAGEARRAIPGRPGTSRHTLATIGVVTLTPVSQASVLSRRGSDAVLAARRVESGRVVQLGYEESWRWRMTGPDGSLEAHREWWSRLVSAVAYQPFDSTTSIPRVARDDREDAAPLARLTAALGPPMSETQARATSTASHAVLLALSFLLLLVEIASRRLRGVR